ncbi:Tyrosine-protein kinase abl2 [Balamuthia mandrillaris]
MENVFGLIPGSPSGRSSLSKRASLQLFSSRDPPPPDFDKIVSASLQTDENGDVRLPRFDRSRSDSGTEERPISSASSTSPSSSSSFPSRNDPVRSRRSSTVWDLESTSSSARRAAGGGTTWQRVEVSSLPRRPFWLSVSMSPRGMQLQQSNGWGAHGTSGVTKPLRSTQPPPSKNRSNFAVETRNSPLHRSTPPGHTTIRQTLPSVKKDKDKVGAEEEETKAKEKEAITKEDVEEENDYMMKVEFSDDQRLDDRRGVQREELPAVSSSAPQYMPSSSLLWYPRPKQIFDDVEDAAKECSPNEPLLTAGNKENTVSEGGNNDKHFTKEEEQEKRQVGGWHLPSPRLNMSEVDAKWKIPFEELQLSQEIGRGAFGICYAAKWRKATVVVKRVFPSSANEKKNMKDFLRETRILQKLRPHRNLVQLLGVCTQPPNLCIVTEYMPMGDVKSLFRRRKLSPRIKLKLALGTAAAMIHLHAENVLHCDLAARNILVSVVDGEYHAKVADFGLAKGPTFSTNFTHPQTFGPIKWMSPEALSEDRVCPKSDVWSFGVLLWELLTEKIPYGPLSLVEAGRLIVSGHLLPIPSYCPPLLCDIILDCWRRNKEERPTFEELYNRLEVIYNEADVSDWERASVKIWANSHDDYYDYDEDEDKQIEVDAGAAKQSEEGEKDENEEWEEPGPPSLTSTTRKDNCNVNISKLSSPPPNERESNESSLSLQRHSHKHSNNGNPSHINKVSNPGSPQQSSCSSPSSPPSLHSRDSLVATSSSLPSHSSSSVSKLPSEPITFEEEGAALSPRGNDVIRLHKEPHRSKAASNNSNNNDCLPQQRRPASAVDSSSRSDKCEKKKIVRWNSYRDPAVDVSLAAHSNNKDRIVRPSGTSVQSSKSFQLVSSKKAKKVKSLFLSRVGLAKNEDY